MVKVKLSRHVICLQFYNHLLSIEKKDKMYFVIYIHVKHIETLKLFYGNPKLVINYFFQNFTLTAPNSISLKLVEHYSIY